MTSPAETAGEPALVMEGVVAVGTAAATCCVASPSPSRKARSPAWWARTGPGKSTVMRVISGLLRPRLGTVTLRKE